MPKLGLLYFLYTVFDNLSGDLGQSCPISTYGDPVVDMLPSQWSRGSSWIPKSLGMRMSCSIQPWMPVNHLYLQIHLGSVAARYLVYPHHHQQQQHKHQHQQQEPKPETRTLKIHIFFLSSLDALQLPGAPRLLLPHCSAVDFVDALPWEGAAKNPQQSPGYGDTWLDLERIQFWVTFLLEVLVKRCHISQ